MRRDYSYKLDRLFDMQKLYSFQKVGLGNQAIGNSRKFQSSMVGKFWKT